MTEINNADAYVKLQLEDRLNAILNTYNTNDQPYFLDDILSHVGNQALNPVTWLIALINEFAFG